VPDVEVECRQALLADPADVRRWAARFALWLTDAIVALS